MNHTAQGHGLILFLEVFAGTSVLTAEVRKRTCEGWQLTGLRKVAASLCDPSSGLPKLYGLNSLPSSRLPVTWVMHELLNRIVQ